MRLAIVILATVSSTVSVKAQKQPYCLYAPNKNCYSGTGWPSCCSEEVDDDCPEEQPPCDVLGSSYCTWSPDYGCFESGWPECCSTNSGSDCPEERPECTLTVTGTSFCTYSPNYSCYETGWPACCSDDGTDCPEEAPPCDLVGGSYCQWAPRYDCYDGGWPSCCADDSSTCPQQQPDCDGATLPGSSYCTYSPNYGCYSSGWPSCCGSEDTSNCPEEAEACDVTDGVTGDSYCTFAPDFSCYPSGWPSCCGDETVECPSEKPPCDDLDGASVCTYAPDYTCYVTGWPSCCESESEVCAADPPCELLYDHSGSTHQGQPLVGSSGPPPDQGADPVGEDSEPADNATISQPTAVPEEGDGATTAAPGAPGASEPTTLESSATHTLLRPLLAVTTFVAACTLAI